MDKLPDMPEDWQQFLVQVGRYAHRKEKAKWEYWQALVYQIVCTVIMMELLRVELVFKILNDYEGVVLSSIAMFISAGTLIFFVKKAKKLREAL